METARSRIAAWRRRMVVCVAAAMQMPVWPGLAAADGGTARTHAVVDVTERQRLENEAFELGKRLFDEGDYEGALAALSKARNALPLARNTVALVTVLNELDRPVEALDMLDALRREFPELSPMHEAKARENLTQLEPLVGVILLDGLQPGARVFLDGEPIGALPHDRPWRLLTGRHVVRVEAPAYEPYETAVEVRSRGQVHVVVKLQEKRPPAPPEPPRSRFALDLAAQGLLGRDTAKCDDGCIADPVWGGLLSARIGHKIDDALHVGLRIGYHHLRQSAEDPTAKFVSPSLTTEGRSYDMMVEDTIALHGVLLALDLGFTPQTRIPVDVRIALGGLAGWASVERSGDYVATTIYRPGYGGFVVAPEIWARTPLRLGEFRLRFGASMLAFIPTSPPELRFGSNGGETFRLEKAIIVKQRSGSMMVLADRGTQGGFNASLMGDVLLAFGVGIGLRREF